MRVRGLMIVAVLGLAGACASPSPHPAVVAGPSAPAPMAAFTPPPPPSLYADPTAPPPGPSLPIPVAIPRDSYAPEPVVQIGSIEIPAIGLKHRLYEGVTLHNIDKGPSHWTGSAMPGELGNAVFAGHRTTETEPFRRINDLAPGDQVIFSVRGARSVYQVTSHMIVAPADSWIADQTPAYTATLYACHPLGSTAQRYVVQLELVR